jgi:hypothetical protein
MNNKRATDLIDDCKTDLERISILIEVLGSTNRAVPFLTKYAIIKVCGTLEQCFKTIICDYASNNQSQHVKNFIDISFRESSINPSIEKIHESLKKFNITWRDSFKSSLNTNVDKERITDSIKSLNNARNVFAHGGNPQTTFNDVENYFEDAKIIIKYIDNSVT